MITGRFMMDFLQFSFGYPILRMSKFGKVQQQMYTHRRILLKHYCKIKMFKSEKQLFQIKIHRYQRYMNIFMRIMKMFEAAERRLQSESLTKLICYACNVSCVNWSIFNCDSDFGIFMQHRAGLGRRCLICMIALQCFVRDCHNCMFVKQLCIIVLQGSILTTLAACGIL